MSNTDEHIKTINLPDGYINDRLSLTGSQANMQGEMVQWKTWKN